MFSFTTQMAYKATPDVHIVRVTHVNPDRTVTIQDAHGHIWFGVARSALIPVAKF